MHNVQCTATIDCHTQLPYQTISNIAPTNCTISNQNTHVPNHLNFNQSSSNRSRLNLEFLWLELFNKNKDIGKVLYCRRHVDTHIWKAHRTRGHTKPGQRGTNNVHLLFQSAQTIKYSNFLHSLAPFVLCALIFINFSKNFWNILHLICQV